MLIIVFSDLKLSIEPLFILFCSIQHFFFFFCLIQWSMRIAQENTHFQISKHVLKYYCYARLHIIRRRRRRRLDARNAHSYVRSKVAEQIVYKKNNKMRREKYVLHFEKIKMIETHHHHCCYLKNQCIIWMRNIESLIHG